MFSQVFFITTILSTLVQSYRLLEYVDRECAGAQVDVLRLAGPSACTNLDYGRAESVIVKIDNVHDVDYTVTFYSDEDCKGGVAHTVHNANGCVDIFNKFASSHHSRSVRVEPVNKAEKRIETENIWMDYGHDEDGNYYTPIAPGVFAPINVSDIDTDGTFTDLDGSIDFFINNTHIDVGTDDREVEYLKDLVDRDLTPALCQAVQHCIDNLDNLNGYGAVKWAIRMGKALKGVPWHKGAKGLQITVDQIANGATLFSAWRSGGTQSKKCDTKYDTGALVEDSMKSEASLSNYTNLVMNFCAENEGCFQYAEYLYLKSVANKGDCGKG